VTFEPESLLEDIDADAFSRCDRLNSFRVPASLKVLRGSIFGHLQSLTSLTFDPGSQITQFVKRSFVDCPSLKSICIPASVEQLCKRSFVDLPRLASLAFAPGSRLRQLDDEIFRDCPSLKSLPLPASVSLIGGQTFLGSSIEKVIVDAANPNYFAAGDFFAAFHETTIIRYLGQAKSATIPRDFGAIGDHAFSEIRTLFSVSFEKGSKVARIDQAAFFDCPSLRSVRIPARVEAIGEFCFGQCPKLSKLSFEAGSVLSQIGPLAFSECRSLKSICFPASLTLIDESAFASCKSLASVTFERGSKLSQIGPSAFDSCKALEHFHVSGMLEAIEEGAFQDCRSLTRITFDIPSRLKKLELPPTDFGTLAIPDSVEVLSGGFGEIRGRNRIVLFGKESRLAELEFAESMFAPRMRQLPASEHRLYVRLSEGALRRFRSKLEWNPSNDFETYGSFW
jgi:hypothetical protein